MELSLALEASAGSGKTFALSVRYCALVLKGANPAHIIALTFTKKAASEMKERVISTLEFLEDKPNELEQIAKLLNQDRASTLKQRDAVIKSFWEATMHIETIDAFIGRILRKFSLHLGVMPDASIEASLDSVALQEAFLLKSKKAGKMPALIEFASAMRWRLVDMFTLFEQLYEKTGELEGIFPPSQTHPSSENIIKYASEIYRFLEKVGAPQSAKGPFEPRTVRGLVQKNFWEKESLNYWHYKKYYTPELDTLFEKLKNAYKDYVTKKEAFLLHELQEAFELYCAVRLSLIAKQGLLTFTDVTNLVYKLLRYEVDKEFLYFRLDSLIEHVLIDEFQDTSVAQLEILTPIIEEIVSGIGVHENRSFFYVGDVKQSIYRFRGGQEALFYETAKRFRVKVDALRINYRTTRAPVAFVNEVFENLLTHYQPQTPNSKEIGYVHVSEDESAIKGVLSALETLLNEGVMPWNIAILTHTNADASVLQEEITEKFPNIAVSTQSSKKLLDSTTIQAIVAYLKFIYFKEPLDRASVFHLSGVCPLVNDALLGKSLPSMILEAVSILCLDGSDVETIALIEAANRYENIEALLFNIERFDALSPSQTHKGITLLTIHKSKGLEFDYVIVSDKLSGDYHGAQPLLFEYEGAKLERIYYVQKQREHVDFVYERAKEKEKTSKMQDRLNALYVAFTRAKIGLVVAKKIEKSIFEPLGILPQLKGKITPSTKSSKSLKSPTITPKSLPALGRQKVEKKSEIELGDLYAKHFGQMLHACLERLYVWDFENIDFVVKRIRSINPFTLEEGDWENIKLRLRRLMEDKIFNSLISSGKIYHEQPLRYKEERKQIDTLIIGKDRVIVIDYKSGEYHPQHRTQLLLYKKAISEITGKETEGWLFYLHEDRIENINL
ncbi:MAG: RecB-like helicase [Campylobacteraceae bacterium]|nr:RecB-like helicase [Campylobacteraceae bacterium]